MHFRSFVEHPSPLKERIEAADSSGPCSNRYARPKGSGCSGGY